MNKQQKNIKFIKEELRRIFNLGKFNSEEIIIAFQNVFEKDYDTDLFIIEVEFKKIIKLK